MLLRFLLIASMVVLGSGCSAWAELHVVPEDTSLVSQGDDGATVIEQSQTVRFLLYGAHSGFETQGFACDDDDVVTTSDPGVLVVWRVGSRNVDVNAYETLAQIWALSAVGTGDVTLHATCGREEKDMVVHVTPRDR